MNVVFSSEFPEPWERERERDLWFKQVYSEVCFLPLSFMTNIKSSSSQNQSHANSNKCYPVYEGLNWNKRSLLFMLRFWVMYCSNSFPTFSLCVSFSFHFYVLAVYSCFKWLMNILLYSIEVSRFEQQHKDFVVAGWLKKRQHIRKLAMNIWKTRVRELFTLYT